MSSVPQEEPTFDGPRGHQSSWYKAHELLQEARYEAVAEVLHQAQIESEQNGQRILADIMAAARRICMACLQCQAETEWHQQAFQEAGQREQALREELDDILELVVRGRVSEPRAEAATLATVPPTEKTSSERDAPKSAEPLNLWQRVLSLLGQGPVHPSPEPKASVEPAKALTTLPTEPIERPGPPATGEREAPTPSSIEAAGTSAASPIEKAKDIVPAQPEKVETPTPSPTEKVEIPAPDAIERLEAPTPRRVAEVEAPAAPPVEKKEEKEEWDLPSLVVYCLGSFRVYQNDQLVAEWRSLKGQSILKYMIMHQGRPVAKDILMDVFWPDVDPEDTRRNLHQAIYSLRQTLRQGEPDLQPILFKKDCYLLNPEMAIWLDFEEFEKHFRAGQRLEAAGQPTVAVAEYSIAEALYQGDFLEEDLYEDWLILQWEHLRNLYLGIAGRLSDYYMQAGEFTAAIALCQKILMKDNCYEEAHRRLMQCYLAQGQRHLAIRQYQTCVQALKEELDLAPAEETMALYRRITTG